jgi:DNA-binding transcriptional MocR family regulator
MVPKWVPDIAGRTGPRYIAIAECMAADIASGRLKAGRRLPTHRDLARRLGVTVATVTRAYAEAERRGLIVGEVGRGTFVRDRSAAGLGIFRIDSPAAEPRFVDMTRDMPAAAGPTLARIAHHANAISAGDLAELFTCNPAAGLPAHREAGAAWIAGRVAGADPARIVLTAGAQNAILLALAALASAGDFVLTEQLTFYGVKATANLLGIRLAGVAMDEDGILPEALEAACRRHAPKAVYLTPTFQIPTSAVMPQARRAAVVEICRRYGTPIVEDDNYGFLDPAGPALAALAPELCLYLTSMSKSVSAGIRIGYLHVPPAMLERVLGALRATTYSTIPLAGEIAARMIRSGDAARAEQWYRELARRRGALAGRLPDPSCVRTHPGSSQLWLSLPEGIGCRDFAAQMQRQGIGVMPGDAFSLDGAPAPGAVRVAFCAPESDSDVDWAFGRMAAFLRGDTLAAGAPLPTPLSARPNSRPAAAARPEA